MDSGNSGSIQSSSGGGDEDYDSRSDSISAFFHSSSSAAAAALPHLPPVQRHHQVHHPPSPFDSLSYLDSNPNSFTYFRPPSSTSQNPTNFTDIPPFIPFTNPPPPPPPPAAVSPGTAPRGSKKRSRASRRAPTTVLTTDTSNFRAMVQEFTGIPAAPFAGSSPFSRPRFLQSSPFNLLNPSFSLKMDTSSSSTTDPIIHFQSLLQSQLAGPRYTLPTMVPGWADGLAGQNGSQSTAGNSGNAIGQRTAGGCKMNYTDPTAADLLHEKGSESVAAAARGEGMLDSNWICSSD